MKNMKNLLVIIFVFSIQFISAQDQELIRAKRFFEDHNDFLERLDDDERKSM